jgi:predicted CopG family antitoxin
MSQSLHDSQVVQFVLSNRNMAFSSRRKITIDATLYERLKIKSEQSGYSSVDEMIRHVLEREVNVPPSPSEQVEVEKQLRGLGYIE